MLGPSTVGMSLAPCAPPVVRFFSSRVRCLVHIGDHRRPTCAAWLLQHGTLLTPATLDRLDEVDRVQRRDAQRQGLSGPRATLPARRKDGRVIGRISS